MIDAVDGGVRLTLHLSPGASSTVVAGTHGDAIKLRLAAPPIDGRANEALIAFLSELLGVAARDVTLVRGQSSRRKVVEVTGVDVGVVERALGVRRALGN